MKNSLKALQNWVPLVQHCWERLRLRSAMWSRFISIAGNKKNLLDVLGRSLIVLGASLAREKKNQTSLASYFCQRYFKPTPLNFPSHASKWLLSSSSAAASQILVPPAWARPHRRELPLLRCFPHRCTLRAHPSPELPVGQEGG